MISNSLKMRDVITKTRFTYRPACVEKDRMQTGRPSSV